MQKSFFENNFHLQSEQTQKLELYISELLHFNQKFSLVSPQPTGRVRGAGRVCPEGRGLNQPQRQVIPPLLVDLMADSVVAGRLLLKKALPGPIADIGSGAGFPGLVLALLDPDREFWLYEVHKKKAGFLEHIAWKLNLKNVTVKNIPIQEEKPNSLNQAVSKAFFSLSKRLELTKSIFKGGIRPKDRTLEASRVCSTDPACPEGRTRLDGGALYYHLQSLSYEREWAKLSPRLKRAWTLVEVEKYSHSPVLSERALLTTRRGSF